MSAIMTGSPPNKVAAHWARKLHNRKLRRFAFLDLGATSGAAPAEDKPDLVDTGQPSRKTFMFPDGRTGKATKKMLLKDNLRLVAREMNIVPGFHLALVSIPKLADAGYTTVFSKDGATIYDNETTLITATSPLVLESERCKHTGMWKLPRPTWIKASICLSLMRDQRKSKMYVEIKMRAPVCSLRAFLCVLALERWTKREEIMGWTSSPLWSCPPLLSSLILKTTTHSECI
jgi:hypothetical protein